MSTSPWAVSHRLGIGELASTEGQAVASTSPRAASGRAARPRPRLPFPSLLPSLLESVRGRAVMLPLAVLAPLPRMTARRRLRASRAPVPDVGSCALLQCTAVGPESEIEIKKPHHEHHQKRGVVHWAGKSRSGGHHTTDRQGRRSCVRTGANVPFGRTAAQKAVGPGHGRSRTGQKREGEQRSGCRAGASARGRGWAENCQG